MNTPALSMAPLMAMEPSLVAGTAARVPLKEPIGVRTALTMTTSCKRAQTAVTLLSKCHNYDGGLKSQLMYLR